jgi:hypothetical protein
MLEPTHHEGAPLYAVRYPHAVGGVESTLKVMSQFLSLHEADQEFDRFSHFFATRSEDKKK